MLKKHPITITFFILYTLLCIRALNLSFEMEQRIKLHPDLSGIAAGGEAVQQVYILLIIIAAIFFFISSGYAIARKNETRFYLGAILTTITETIITINVG